MRFSLPLSQEMVPIPEQQAVLIRMRALRDAGNSLRAVADLMTGEGIKISHVGVKNALIAADRNPPPSRETILLAELDARGAPDIDYRQAFSTAPRPGSARARRGAAAWNSG
jgi:hypothetical protein